MKNTVVLFKGRPFDPKSPDFEEAYWPPLALLSLASPLRQAGFKVVILEHIHSIEDNIRRLREVLDDTLYVGISALTGFEIHDGLLIARALKEARPDIPVVWGGWHACSLPEETLAHPDVDIVVAGLGQKVAVRIAERLQKGVRHFSDLPSTHAVPEWNSDPIPAGEAPVDPMDLTEVDPPAYDLIDLDFARRDSLLHVRKLEARGLKITGKINYVTSFGCPFRCTYCSNPDIFGSAWAGYSIDKMVAQIKWLTERGFNWIEFIDAEFIVRWNRLQQFLQAIVDAGITIRWASQASVKGILQLERRGLMPLVVQSGCFAFHIGAESGSANVLDYVKKKQSADEIVQVARVLKKHGVEGSFNCLVGLPKREGFADLDATFRLAYEVKKVCPEFTFPISFYTPMPGSEMFRDAVDVGFKHPSDLEGWGSYQSTYRIQADNLPWRSSEMEKRVYQVLTFYLPMAVPGDIRRGTITHLKRHLKEHRLRHLIWVGHKLAALRMRTCFFGLPFEHALFKLYRKLAGKGEYIPGGRSPDVKADPVFVPGTTIQATEAGPLPGKE